MFVSFINNAWGDTHNLNRIQGLRDVGIQFRIYAYRRSFYPPKENLSFIDLGSLDQLGTLARFYIYIKAFFVLWRAPKMDNEILYVFGFDNLFIIQCIRLFKWKKSKVIFEIPDIKKFQLMKSIQGNIFYRIEKWLIARTDHIVFTSPAYANEYYQALKNMTLPSYSIVENKIHKAYNTQETTLTLHRSDQISLKTKIVIGYFGLLRCEASLLFLDELTKKFPQYFVILRGVFLDNTLHLKERLAKNINISYLGKYVSPIHLKDMYNEIDLSFIAYPFSNKVPGNWQWARTNRYYEAGYYKKPMIVGKGTADGKEVLKRKIGIEINLQNISNEIEYFHDFYTHNINSWLININALKEEEFVMSDEYVKLLKTMKLLSV